MKIPFLGASYTSRSKSLASQETLNLYIEPNESGQGEAAALYGTPGTRLLVTMPNSGGIRGLHAPASGDAIVVQYDKVYRLKHSTWTYTVCTGTMLLNSGTVSIADNGTTAVIVDGLYGYVLDLTTNVLTQITDPAFYGADKVGYLDGYYVFNKPNTQQFYISSLAGTSFDALDFASAEGATDNLISLLVDHRELWLFGDTSTEVFSNTGNADFPIERIGGAFLEHGCVAKFSPAKLDNTVFWLGKDSNGAGTVWRAAGYTPQRVSTHAIEYAIASYARMDDAISYTYQQEGHAFYVLSFPTANKTWCYDAATGAWHERAYRNPTTGDLERHRSNNHIYFGSTNVVGDYANGNVYALDLNYYSDNGSPMLSRRAAAVLYADGKRQFFKALQIEMEEGIGLTTGQGSDPQAVLDWSDDNGKTWSNEHWATIGALGKYGTGIKWNRLGAGRDRVFRVSITDPIKRVIVGATIEGAAGSN